MKDSIAIITVNYNTSDYSVSYINNILSCCKNFNLKIIVIDNFSTKSERDILCGLNQYENVRLVFSDNNVGYFKGLNIGLDILGKELKTYKYVIVGNNDLKFYDNFFEELFKLDLEDEIMVIAPDIITPDGSHQNPHFRNRLGLLNRFKLKIYFSNYYIGNSLLQINKFIRSKFFGITNKFQESSLNKEIIYMGKGALYILTNSFLQKYDKLDDGVFLYGEEALIANQVVTAKGKTIFIPELKVLHYESISTSHISSRIRYNITKESYKTYHKYL